MGENSTAITIIKICELIILLGESIICGLLPLYWFKFGLWDNLVGKHLKIALKLWV